MLPWLIAGGVFSLVALTASHYGLTWDEPNYFHASNLEIRWLVESGKNLLKGDIAMSLRDDVIRSAWHWDPYHVPHPPFSRILSGLAETIFSPIVDKFTAYRLAPALFFALLTAVMYSWMASLFDRATGFFAALSLVLIPNLFGFAHFAVTDMPLAVMWFLTLYCFWRGLENWRWSLVLGVVWGLALSTKFPALVIPIPLLLWAHLYRRPFYANNLFSMIFLSPLIMIASQPYLWHQTSRRILEFLYDGLSRGYRPETNFAIFFLNKIHATSTVPWYYPSFMTVVTVPETILLLSLTGALALFWVKPRRQVMVLFLFNAVLILVMGLLPGAVLHDVNRLMLPVLPCLVGLAGSGFFLLVRYLKESCQKIPALQAIRYLPAKLVGIVYALALFPPGFDLYLYHPYELSYYNRLVGGLRGAYERGLEVTYFMEAMGPDFLRLLNRELPANAVVNASFSNFMLAYYQEENRLRRDIRLTDKGDFDYYILLTRLSSFSQTDRLIFSETRRPYASIQVFGVPLVSIYKAKGPSQ